MTSAAPRRGRLVAIEGLDGSGKRTLTAELVTRARAQGLRVATLAFPRYDQDVHAELVRDALHGRLGDLAESVHGPAVLFALDRRAAREELLTLLAEHDLVLLDRYISSNAAYGAARLGGPEDEGAATTFQRWVHELEVARFGCPVPDEQLLLATPTSLAAQRARDRATATGHRALDAFERDADLQARTAAVYAQLARDGYLSPWTVLTPRPDGSVPLPADWPAG